MAIKRDKIPKICEACGIKFLIHPCRIKTAKFCSCICKGKSYSPETRLKMSLSRLGNPSPRKGVKLSLEVRRNMSKSKLGLYRGEKSCHWKGGVTTQNNLDRAKFRKSFQSLVFARDNYTCQVCDQYGGYLQADHIKSWAKHPDLRFDLSNCRTLCMACHYYVTFKRKLPQGVVWGHNFGRRISQ